MKQRHALTQRVRRRCPRRRLAKARRRSQVPASVQPTSRGPQEQLGIGPQSKMSFPSAPAPRSPENITMMKRN
jgi:hypothetical protein